MNDLDPTSAPKIQKSKLGVRKLEGIDIMWSNLYGNQPTHFVGYNESLNTKNSSYNPSKIGTTSNVRPTLYISLANEKKT
jgi:hypothetical protein